LVNRIIQYVTIASHERQKYGSPNANQKTPRRQKMKLTPGTPDGWGSTQSAFLLQIDHIEDRKKMNDVSQNKYFIFLFLVYLTKQENDEQQESRKLQLLSSS
jgi:hypothetical protein